MHTSQENPYQVEISAEYKRLRSIAPRWTPAQVRESVVDTFSMKWSMAKDEVAEIVDDWFASQSAPAGSSRKVKGVQYLQAQGYSVESSKSQAGKFRWWRETESDGACVPKRELSEITFGTEAAAWADAQRDSAILFPDKLSKEAFLELQDEAEALEMAHAKGQDLPQHGERLKQIDSIVNAGPWTLHPDYGCILKSEVDARDQAAMRPS